MRGYAIINPGVFEKVELNEKEYFEPGPGWVTVQVVNSGICGTDLHIYKGEYLGSYPIIPGHEFSEKIVAVGQGVSRVRIGDRIAVEPNISCGICAACLKNRQHFCDNWQAVGVTLPGGMATHVKVPQEAVFKIGHLSFRSAAWVEPLSCVLHGVDRLHFVAGSRILLIGAGPIGLLLYRVLSVYGAAEIVMIEHNSERVNYAENHGVKQIRKNLTDLNSKDYDIVVDATGAVSVLEQTLDFVRPSGQILFFGVPQKEAEMKLQPFKIFEKEISIIGSFTSLRKTQQSIDLMLHKKLVVEDLISHTFKLDSIRDAFELPKFLPKL
ncbi:MAG: alcohol dehydrogenase catalytic domain-containing protein [Bacteroidetes bacterium]|nr:alcohol dehydrogenase catalytic domain-containing protein [Bacteroidota bacterium]